MKSLVEWESCKITRAIVLSSPYHQNEMLLKCLLVKHHSPLVSHSQSCKYQATQVVENKLRHGTYNVPVVFHRTAELATSDLMKQFRSRITLKSKRTYRCAERILGNRNFLIHEMIRKIVRSVRVRTRELRHGRSKEIAQTDPCAMAPTKTTNECVAGSVGKNLESLTGVASKDRAVHNSA